MWCIIMLCKLQFIFLVTFVFVNAGNERNRIFEKLNTNDDYLPENEFSGSALSEENPDISNMPTNLDVYEQVEFSTSNSNAAEVVAVPKPYLFQQRENRGEVLEYKQLKGEDYKTCYNAVKNIHEEATLLLDGIHQKDLIGSKGDRGVPGERGIPGFAWKGEKGNKGDRVIGPRGPIGPMGPAGPNGMKGDKGLKGDVGLEGVAGPNISGQPGPKGNKGECIVTRSDGRPGAKGATGIGFIQFSTLSEMKQMERTTRPGSIAYIEESGRFYGRVPRGWALLLMQFSEITYNQKQRIPIQERLANRKAERAIRKPNAGNPKTRDNRKESSRLRLVALNEPSTGNMHGIDFINYQCQKEAMEVGVDGIFRAFLSIRGVNLKSLVNDGQDTTPIVNLRNKTLFTSWNAIFSMNKKLAHRDFETNIKNITHDLYSFNGKSAINSRNSFIWHGAHLTGRGSQRNCKNWTTSDSTETGIVANVLLKYILHRQNEKCNKRHSVLCLEIPSFAVREFTLHKIQVSKHLKEESPFRPTFEEYKRILKYYDDGEK